MSESLQSHPGSHRRSLISPKYLSYLNAVKYYLLTDTRSFHKIFPFRSFFGQLLTSLDSNDVAQALVDILPKMYWPQLTTFWHYIHECDQDLLTWHLDLRVRISETGWVIHLKLGPTGIVRERRQIFSQHAAAWHNNVTALHFKTKPQPSGWSDSI